MELAARASTLRAHRPATFLISVVPLLLGVVVRGEHVAAIAIAGGALCLAGAWLIRRGTMR